MISWTLTDSDHEREEHCTLAIDDDELRVEVQWQLEISPDYLADGDPGPAADGWSQKCEYRPRQ